MLANYLNYTLLISIDGWKEPEEEAEFDLKYQDGVGWFIIGLLAFNIGCNLALSLGFMILE